MSNIDSLSKLNKDELINKILELEKMHLKDQKIIDELTRLVNNNKQIIKKYNVERFVSKADNANQINTGVKNVLENEKKKCGRKKGSKNFGEDYLENLSKLNDPITLDIAESIQNNDNIKLVKINEEHTFLIKRIAASVKVYKVIIPIYKGSDDKFYRHEHISPIHHGIVDSSLLSDAITMKYFLGVPEYRYAKWLDGEGLPFNQKTLNNWAINSSMVLNPFYEYIKSLFASTADIKDIHIDETWLDVIDNKKYGREKSYIFSFLAKSRVGKIPLFMFSKDRKTECVDKLLEGYTNNITVDGYAGYNSVQTGKITIQRCMVHARREFANIVKTLKSNELKSSKAYRAVGKFDAIFLKEKEMKRNKLTPEEKVRIRNSPEYQELVNDLNDFINNLSVEKGSPLASAKNYWINLANNQWTYLNDGNIDLDNNEAERQCKKFVIDRKNFLFARSEKGAKSACILLTIIDLAYENNIEPRGYLEFLLNNINKVEFNQLLPWSHQIPKELLTKM